MASKIHFWSFGNGSIEPYYVKNNVNSGWMLMTFFTAITLTEQSVLCRSLTIFWPPVDWKSSYLSSALSSASTAVRHLPHQDFSDDTIQVFMDNVKVSSDVLIPCLIHWMACLPAVDAMNHSLDGKTLKNTLKWPVSLNFRRTCQTYLIFRPCRADSWNMPIMVWRTWRCRRTCFTDSLPDVVFAINFTTVQLPWRITGALLIPQTMRDMMRPILSGLKPCLMRSFKMNNAFIATSQLSRIMIALLYATWLSWLPTMTMEVIHHRPVWLLKPYNNAPFAWRFQDCWRSSDAYGSTSWPSLTCTVCDWTWRHSWINCLLPLWQGLWKHDVDGKAHQDAVVHWVWSNQRKWLSYDQTAGTSWSCGEWWLHCSLTKLWPAENLGSHLQCLSAGI